MAEAVHPAASHHMPSFITSPGDTDVLMVVMAVVLAASVLGFGLLFFRLHSLPERMAHQSKKIQFEIVAVLCLISLFTHMHIFWVAGLLLAFIDLPDFGGSLSRIAGSTEKLAGLKPGEGVQQAPPPASADGHGHEPQHEFAFEDHRSGDDQGSDQRPKVFASPKLVPAEREVGHA